MADRSHPLVLVIDDHPLARAFTREVLQRDGLGVLEAASAADGMRLATSEKPDVIVLDVRLPDADGFEVCRQLKTNRVTAGVPVLQVSGEYRKPGDRVRGLHAGAGGYLVKPTRPRSSTVRTLLRLRRAEAESEERFLALMDAIPVLVVATTAAGAPSC